MKATEMCEKIVREAINARAEREAEEQLNADGYFPQECPKCEGKGEFLISLGIGCWPLKCDQCGGDGKAWIKKTE